MDLARGGKRRRCESGKSSNGVRRCPGAAEGVSTAGASSEEFWTGVGFVQVSASERGASRDHPVETAMSEDLKKTRVLERAVIGGGSRTPGLSDLSLRALCRERCFSLLAILSPETQQGSSHTRLFLHSLLKGLFAVQAPGWDDAVPEQCW